MCSEPCYEQVLLSSCVWVNILLDGPELSRRHSLKAFVEHARANQLVHAFVRLPNIGLFQLLVVSLLKLFFQDQILRVLLKFVA